MCWQLAVADQRNISVLGKSVSGWVNWKALINEI